MHIRNYILIFSSIYLLSCSSNQNQNNASKIYTSKADSLFQLALNQYELTHEFKDLNIAINLCPNDSIKQELIHSRRKAFQSIEEFEKTGLSIEQVLKVNPCYAPIISKIDRINNKSFRWNDLYNETFDTSNYYSRRFVVGDFNTLDENGNCKGCEEQYPSIWTLPELNEFFLILTRNNIDLYNQNAIETWIRSRSASEQTDLLKWNSTWVNLLTQVEAYRTEPMIKPAVIEVKGSKYCIGQRMCLCEIQNDTIIKIAQFVTSSKNASAAQNNQRDFDGQRRYYAPMNRLTTRFWDDNSPYNPLDKQRDIELNGGSSRVIRYKGKVKLPNFMHITPDDAFPGAKGFVN
ncbi:MAG: hypothetical protein ACKO8Q_05990, partial [Bacteroidota bacterium]